MNNSSTTLIHYLTELYQKSTKSWQVLSEQSSRSEAEADLASFLEFREANKDYSDYIEAKISLKTVKTETNKEILKMIEL